MQQALANVLYSVGFNNSKLNGAVERKVALVQKRCLRCLQASTYASSLLTGAGLGSSLTAPQPAGGVPATFNASSAGASYLTQQRPTLVLLGPSSVQLLQGGPVWDRCWPRSAARHAVGLGLFGFKGFYDFAMKTKGVKG
jgi:hypothetical protein